jgi:hypothetical protein
MATDGETMGSSARGSARALTALFSLCLLLWGCSGSADEPTPPTATAAPSPTPVEPSPGSTGPTATPAPTPEPTAAAADALPAGTLVVASDRGVDVVGPDGTSEAWTSIPARSAFADGAGGVVFQGTSPPGEDPPSPAVMWLPPDGGDAVTVVPDGYADVVTLQDGGLIGGRPSAVLTIRTDVETPEDATETLRVLPLGPDAAGTEPRAVTEIGGWESGAGVVTLGDDVLAVNSYAESESWFDFYDLTGEPVEVPANPLPDSDRCLGEPDCPYLVATDVAGERIAWLTGDVGAGGTLTVVPRDSSSEPLVVEWPPQDTGVVFERLELGRDTAVVTRARDTGEGFAPIAPLVVDLAGGGIHDGELDGFTSVAAS